MRPRVRGNTVKLKGLWRDPRNGQPFYRTRAGGKAILVRLPNLPNDHPDLIAAWAAAARQEAAPDPAKPGTIASIWNAVLGGREAAAWSEGYRATIRRHAAALCAAYGHLPAKGVAPRHITKDVAEADNPLARHKAWRAWGAWGMAHGYLPRDPAADVARPESLPSDGHPPWFEDSVQKFRARWPIGTVARAAMELMHFVGCRVSDAVLIGPQHVGRDGVLAYRQAKTGDMAYCPWSCALPAYAAHLAADRDMMKAALAPLSGHMTFLATSRGKTRSAKALTTLMSEACDLAGIAESSHGLRKWRPIDLIEHGASSAQASAWTGHRTLAELERYIARRDRRRAVMGAAPERQMETRASRVETGR